MKPVSGWQFAIFRIALGTYLLIHFVELVPYGAELFSREGVLPDAGANPTHGILPNPLEHWDSPAFVSGFLVAMAGLSTLLALGAWRRTAAVVLWFGWACLFNRNNLISNPSIPYVGLLLLLVALIPAGEPLRLGRRSREWFFPAAAFWTAWALMAVGYTFSGLAKLASPSWIDGTAITHLVNNPLARPGVLRDLFLAAPSGLHALLTWGTLAAEILFLPLALFSRTRPVAWGVVLAMHLGILAVVDFADLSFGMVLLHLFTFDPDWLPARRRGRTLVLYDGDCGLCDRIVRFLVAEDRAGVLTFAPLGGPTARAEIEEGGAGKGEGEAPQTIVLVTVDRKGERVLHRRSAAALRILDSIGGFWRVVSWLRLVPRVLRDPAYDWIARRRYGWFGRVDTCTVPSPEVRTRFLP